MSTPVADRSSNKNDQIVNAAEVLGRSKQKREVFREIYSGKKRQKTVQELIDLTGFPHTRVLDAGKALHDNDIVTCTRENGETTYGKISFFQRYRDRILRYSEDERARKKVPTKTRPHASGTVTIKIRQTRDARAVVITIDDVDSFAKVRKIQSQLPLLRIGETKFKNGIAKILGEKATFKDWGGELRDLSSSRVVIGGKRRWTAFAFKGPGKSGRLTPAKMGKNGDQIQRLVRCPAEVFLVQYWREIDDAVLEQLEKLVQLKAAAEGRTLWYGIIDGQDSARLVEAYPKHFKR